MDNDFTAEEWAAGQTVVAVAALAGIGVEAMIEKIVDHAEEWHVPPGLVLEKLATARRVREYIAAHAS